jgi:hypothetical protein
MPADTRESLQSIISSIQKKYGDDIIVKGSDVKEEMPRITTGVLAFDHAWRWVAYEPMERNHW